jgi:hypothetical protein
MASLMLVNPRRRKRRMSAKQRKYFGNPHHRKHRHVSRRRHHYSHNPSFRNVGASVMPTLKGGLIGAAGAIGSDLAYGFLTTQSASIPSFAANPAVATAGKLVVSLIIGIVGNMLPMLKGKGGALAVGAATCAIHDFAKSQLQSASPTLALGDYLTAAPTVGNRGLRSLTRAYRPVGAYVTGRGARQRLVAAPVRGSRGAMGQYLSDSNFSNGIPLT